MAKPQDMERIVRGLERCGYHLYVVADGETLRGIMTLFPDTRQEPAATRRTCARWEKKWQEISEREPPRSIAEHLQKTGRTWAAIQARRHAMRERFYRPAMKLVS